MCGGHGLSVVAVSGVSGWTSDAVLSPHSTEGKPRLSTGRLNY